MKKLAGGEVEEHRDAILTALDEATEHMPLLQRKEFIEGLVEDVQNQLNNVNDEIASIRADTACTCTGRGKYGIHTKKCAKTKAVK